MTSDQYTELVAFLGTKFDEIKQQFAGVDQRFDRVERRLDAHDEQFVEVRRHATVLFEQARDERRKMAEGLGARSVALESKVASLDASVRVTLADHEARLQALE